MRLDEKGLDSLGLGLVRGRCFYGERNIFSFLRLWALVTVV